MISIYNLLLLGVILKILYMPYQIEPGKSFQHRIDKQKNMKLTQSTKQSLA